MWMHVSGKVAWYVFQGPYSNMTLAWAEFMKKVQNSKVGEIVGPPGDVYVCDPQEHKGNEQKLTTILWTPLKE
jgi:effector-binding domain-containing protein